MTTIHELVLSDRDFHTVRKHIYDLAGIVIVESKRVMVQGRLNKRLRALGLDSYTEYLRYLMDPQNKEETTSFINTMTTNKTDFFREKHHFDFLTRQAFPEIVRRAEQGRGRKLRIWCSASSTGEEPYSIAMTIREFFGTDSSWDIRVLASDIDTDVLSTASKGVYTSDRVEDLPKPLLLKYFDRCGESENADVIAKPTLRDLLTFRQINLQHDQWPINTIFDIVFCRNVLIYFDADSQRKIVQHFGDHLNQQGYLMLGHSESLIGLSERYRLMGDTVYCKTDQPMPRSNVQRGATLEASTQLDVRSEVAGTPTSRFGGVNRPTVQSEQVAPEAKDPKHPIIIGEIYASDKPEWITTLLGSCVAVCLYDDNKKIGGMNHFMLPQPADAAEFNQRFGNHSMERLVDAVMALGADRRQLKAKVFGGNRTSHLLKSSFAKVGEVNVEFALAFLESHKIPLVSSFTLQDRGVQVKFHTRTAKVLVHLLDQELSEIVHQTDTANAAIVRDTLCGTIAHAM